MLRAENARPACAQPSKVRSLGMKGWIAGHHEAPQTGNVPHQLLAGVKAPSHAPVEGHVAPRPSKGVPAHWGRRLLWSFCSLLLGCGPVCIPLLAQPGLHRGQQPGLLQLWHLLCRRACMHATLAVNSISQNAWPAILRGSWLELGDRHALYLLPSSRHMRVQDARGAGVPLHECP